MKALRQTATVAGLAVGLLIAAPMAFGGSVKLFKVFPDYLPDADEHEGIDYAYACLGGIRDIENGGILRLKLDSPDNDGDLRPDKGEAIVKAAYLYWHGHGDYNEWEQRMLICPAWEPPPYPQGTAELGGRTVECVGLGISGSDNWDGAFYGEAFRADVTDIVRNYGVWDSVNGTWNYTLRSFVPFGTHVQGASLIVFYYDSDSGNDRQYILYDGTDSSFFNDWDGAGWNVSLIGINYKVGDFVTLDLHVSDGQSNYGEAPLKINGQNMDTPSASGLVNVFTGSAPCAGWPHGDTCPAGYNHVFYQGTLWDAVRWNLTDPKYNPPLLTEVEGGNNLLTTEEVKDECITLVAAVVGKSKDSPPPGGDGGDDDETPNNPPTVQGAGEIHFCAPGDSVVKTVSVTVSDPDVDQELTAYWIVDGSIVSTVPVPAATGGVEVSLKHEFSAGDPEKQSNISVIVSDGYAAVDAIITVLVRKDTTPPSLTCPGPLTVTIGEQDTALVPDLTTEVTVSDSGGCGSATVTQHPPAGTEVGVGQTVITLVATDTAGNSSQCDTLLTVTGTAEPSVTCAVGEGIFWPPNHNCLVDVGLTVTTENVAGPLDIVVYSNQDDETPTGDGKFSPDAKWSADTGVLRLRTERKGDSRDKIGRVYLIVVNGYAVDGRKATCLATVGVPHDQSKAALERLAAQSAEAVAYYSLNDAPPSGFALVGDGPVIGPKQ